MAEDYNNTYLYQTPQTTAAEENTPTTVSTAASWVDIKNSQYLKGLAIGAGIALLASNPKVQKAVVSGGVKLWAGLQGGIEEAKEKIQDMKAESTSSK